MAINYDKLINWSIPEVEQRLTRRDTILYALGVGLGADPRDAGQLRFVYEEGLQRLPTMAIILCGLCRHPYLIKWQRPTDGARRCRRPPPRRSRALSMAARAR